MQFLFFPEITARRVSLTCHWRGNLEVGDAADWCTLCTLCVLSCRARGPFVLHTQECWFFPAVFALLASESGTVVCSGCVFCLWSWNNCQCQSSSLFVLKPSGMPSEGLLCQCVQKSRMWHCVDLLCRFGFTCACSHFCLLNWMFIRMDCMSSPVPVFLLRPLHIKCYTSEKSRVQLHNVSV